jgi:hypothetical protein
LTLDIVEGLVTKVIPMVEPTEKGKEIILAFIVQFVGKS